MKHINNPFYGLIKNSKNIVKKSWLTLLATLCCGQVFADITVVYHSNDGDDKTFSDNITAESDSTLISVSTSEFTVPSCKAFSAWAIGSADATGKEAGTSIADELRNLEDDAILDVYAQWTDVEQTVTVSYVDDNGNKIAEDGSFSGIVGEAIPAPEFPFYKAQEVLSKVACGTTEASIAYELTPVKPTKVADFKYDGISHELIVAGESSAEKPFLYSLDNETWSKDIPSAKKAGTHTVYYKIDGESIEGSLEITIEKKVLSVQWGEKDTFIYNSLEQHPTATLSSYIDGDNVSVSVTGGTNASSYTSIASLEGDDKDNYILSDATKSKDFKIVAAEPVFEAPTIITGLKYTSQYQALVSETPTTLGSFQYKVNNAEWSSTAQGKDVDTYSIAYLFTPESPNYKSVSGNIGSVSISKAEIVLTWTGDSFNYDQTEKSPIAEIESGVKGEDNVTVSVSGAKTNVGGPYTATATLDELSAKNYEISNPTHDFKISKSEYSVTEPSPNDLTYSGDPLVLITIGSATIDGKFLYNIDKGELSATIPSAINAGNYSVGYVFIPTDNNYTSTDTAYVNVSIKKANVNLVNPTAKSDLTYTGSQIDLLEEYSVSEGTISYSVNDGDWSSSATGINAGQYKIAFKFTPDSNHNDASIEDMTVDIAKATISPTISREGWTYGENPSEFKAVVGNNGAGEVTYTYYTNEDCGNATTSANGATEEGEVPSFAGTYYIKADIEATTNYEAGSAKAAFTIAQKEITIDWGNTEFTYTGESQKPTAKAVGVIKPDTVIINVTGAQTNAGNYSAKATSFSGENFNNYKLSADSTISFSIAKADPKNITAPTAKSIIYNASKQALITAGGVNGGKMQYAIGNGEYTDTIPMARNAGSYNIVYRIVGDDNHNDADGDTIHVTIAKKTLEVLWGETEFTYKPETQQKPTASVTPLNGDSVFVNVTGAAITLGTYEAIATLIGKDKNNYDLTSAQASTEFKIVSALVEKPVITDREFTYNGQYHTFVRPNQGYTVNGKLGEKEPGKYIVSIVPSEGFVWVDNTRTAIKDSFLIKRIALDIPVPDQNEFTYNATLQTYAIKADTAYTVSGNQQTNAGEHIVTVAIKNTNHFQWRDGSTTNKTYNFNIAKKIVAVPTAAATEFVYDATEKDFAIPASIDYVVADSNATGTNAGDYIRTVSLNDKFNYLWEDNTTRDTSFKFTIKPQTVKKPVVTDKEFIYNGKPYTFVVPADTVTPARYIVKKKVSFATLTGTYTDTLTLVDKRNFAWEDGTTDDILIDFKIGDGTVGKPNIPTTHTYTGSEISFVPENNAYKVINGSGINVGTYKVKVVPNPGYKWEDIKTSDTLFATVKINEALVDIPKISPKQFTYNGKSQDFKIPANKGYEITGSTSAVEPGTYKATLTLEPNYLWNDSTSKGIDLYFTINKISVPTPAPDPSTFEYTGKPQEYMLLAHSACKVSNHIQTNAGSYIVSVSIDTTHYMWANPNVQGDVTFNFDIAPAKVNEPSISKTSFTYDGHVKSFDIATNSLYVVNPKNSSATAVGTYIRTVSLADTLNYVWNDATKSKADKTFTFEIKAILIDVPTVEREYEYTGKPITFVPDSVAYTVTNGTKTNADSYIVTIVPKVGYAWRKNNGASDTITVPVVIKPAYVDKPVIKDTAFIYNGQIKVFGFSKNIGYTIFGDTAATEPGKYHTRVSLNDNYIWHNEETDDQLYNFEILKIEVPVPAADAKRFVYNGEEQIYTIKEDTTIYSVSGNAHTKAGTYTVTAALKDSLHYIWADTTTDNQTYTFVIAKASVANPTAVLSTFIFDGKEKEFKVVENANYTVADSNAVATQTGTYIRTVTLKDSTNYSWADKTTAPKSVTFVIGDGTLLIPEVALEYTYTGDTIIFVPNDGAYTVENGAKTEVGKYKVTVTPKPGYRWSDSTKTAKVYNVVINPIMVEKPSLTTAYTYNYKAIDFKIPANDAYAISGETNGLEIGSYKASLTLKPNYMWTDSTTAKVDYLFTINKKVISIPPADTTEYVYNGRRQTYSIANNPDYHIFGNVQAYAGTYDVTLFLIDSDHTIWSDSTSMIKTYKFEIDKAKVSYPTAVQPSFVYDGATKYFSITENKDYEVLSSNASGVEVGEYIRTIALKDTLNYTWIDGTILPKTVKFTISKGTIEIPVIEKEFTYNGTPFTFVSDNPAYTVENGMKTDAGTYTVTVTLHNGYVWEDATTEVKSYKVTINPAKVEKPALPETSVFTYTGTGLGTDVPEHNGYTINGVTKAVEPGIYNSEIVLGVNYIWADSTVAPLTSTLVIYKVLVDVPSGIDSTFRYNGKSQIYAIPDTIDSYTVSGHHRTNAGMYTVSAALNDTVHYMWKDSTIKNKTYSFNIARAVVEIPTSGVDSFVFDGNPKGFVVVVNDTLKDSIYVVNGPKSAIETGIYENIVELTDTINYWWADSTWANKQFQFVILKNVIPAISPKTFVYTGNPISLIDTSLAYTVANGVHVDAGSYNVEVTPRSGYSWADGTTTSKIVTTTITKKPIAVPVVDTTTFIYSGMLNTFTVPVGDSCSYYGDSTAIEPGEYHIYVVPSKNHIWKDTVSDTVLYTFNIKRIPVNVPAADPNIFYFNNKEQTYGIASTAYYTVTGNVQQNVGSYMVTVTLNDPVHYEWTDATNSAKNYPFSIINKEFNIETLVQSEDGSLNVTPGGTAILDLNIEGDVFGYSIECPTCPALNDSFTAVNSKLDKIEIDIPDTIAPGKYELTVSFVSGTLVKKQTLELTINYPASNIVVCWSNVLMVDNKAGKFHSYQWYKNDELIPNATSQYYQDKSGLNGFYYCEVDGGLIIGPAFFEMNSPIVMKARVEGNEIVVDVIGKINTQITLMNVSGFQFASQPAGKNVRFEIGQPGIYILNLEGTKQSVKVCVSEL
ncbi:MAG: hypothetical protein MJZ00_01005 [Paludibacteraceae bacterium]|nr:hypothetical protein [Paludibacteraceae bacterium]